MAIIAGISIQQYLILRALRVVYVRRVVDERGKEIPLMVDDKLTLYVTDKWCRWDVKDRAVGLMHEAEHVLCLHPIRGKELIKRYESKGYAGNLRFLVNVAADMKVWQMLSDYYNLAKAKMKLMEFVKATNIAPEIIRRESMEGLFKKLLENASKITINVVADVGEGEFKCEGEEHTINEGRDELYGSDSKNDVDGNVGEEMKERLKKLVGEVLYAAKMAGAKLTMEQEYVYAEMFKPKIDWRAMLRNTIRRTIGELRRMTWRKESRRITDWYGYDFYGKAKVLVLEDTSGSITNEEHEQFLSEVRSATREAGEVYLVQWDTDIVARHNLKRESDVRRKVRKRGGGGTKIVPILKKIGRELREYDIMVVLTDGHWFDDRQAEAMLKKLRMRKILVTTDKIPCSDVWHKIIKIEVG